MSIIGGHGERHVRMAHLAIVGSHKVNGVSSLHAELMRSRVFADFDRLFPGRIVGKTNGITTRRWLQVANPELSALITSQLGEGWQTHLEKLEGLLAGLSSPVTGESVCGEAETYLERIAQSDQATLLAVEI